MDSRASRWIVVSACVAALVLASPAAADVGSGETDHAFQIRLGGFFPRGGDGELWELNEALYTLERSDFDSGVIGFTYLGSLGNHLELGLNLDLYGKTVRSAQRDLVTGQLWVDGDGFTVLHDTDLSVAPATVDLRLLPFGRYRMRPGGRRVLKPVVYVGAGAGVSFWEYEELGDFVDDFDPDDPFIFTDRFRDTGVAFETHVLGGVEFPVSRRLNLLVEGRYSWADGELDESWAGFYFGGDDDELELGGASIQGGLSFRF